MTYIYIYNIKAFLGWEKDHNQIMKCTTTVWWSRLLIGANVIVKLMKKYHHWNDSSNCGWLGKMQLALYFKFRKIVIKQLIYSNWPISTPTHPYEAHNKILHFQLTPYFGGLNNLVSSALTLYIQSFFLRTYTYLLFQEKKNI